MLFDASQSKGVTKEAPEGDRGVRDDIDKDLVDRDWTEVESEIYRRTRSVRDLHEDIERLRKEAEAVLVEILDQVDNYEVTHGDRVLFLRDEVNNLISNIFGTNQW